MSHTVSEFCNTIIKKGASVEAALRKIIPLVKVAMGEFTGLSNLVNDLDGTIELACSSSDNYNSYKKMKVSEDGTRLLGVLFVGKTNECTTSCIGIKSNIYSIFLSIKLYSIKIKDTDHIESLQEMFGKRFDDIIDNVDQEFNEFEFNKKKEKSRGICGAREPSNKSRKSTVYKIDLYNSNDITLD